MEKVKHKGQIHLKIKRASYFSNIESVSVGWCLNVNRDLKGLVLSCGFFGNYRSGFNWVRDLQLM